MNIKLSSCASYSFPSFPSLFYDLLAAPLLRLRGKHFYEQHWNLVNIVFMVAKLGNICFGRKICVRKLNKNVLARIEEKMLFVVSEQQNLFP